MFRDEARGLGLARVGFAAVGPWQRHAFYRRWLADGHAGEMGYLAEQAEERRDPRALLAAARTVVSVALSYAQSDPIVPADRLARGRVARYARGVDYHLVLKDKLRALAARAEQRLGRPLLSRACVDTAPLLEHEAAAAAGLGFIAKNTLLIAPGAGSYLVLGELLVDVEAEPGAPEEPRCGRCRACLDACPTGAFVDAYTLDARRCISYLTIESHAPIPRALRPLVGDMIFGCDRCQEVCPWNAGDGHADAVPADPSLSAAHSDRARPPLQALLRVGSAQHRKLVARTALRRVTRAQLLRNVAVALGNVGGAGDLAGASEALGDRSALVRGHAAWAVGRLGARHSSVRAAARAALSARLTVEGDATAREELRAALDELDGPGPCDGADPV